ncbi:hypothetical protein QVD17_26031 [Tagetes erecta]|uniref:Protein BIG GRAIN 1-like B n=1 Tax=Tagetes erecta TaxID=13708 RepID=A0AAD8NPY8_TARER|nr:hypothetical protein QVD17_26031 [Tagetes erecta]
MYKPATYNPSFSSSLLDEIYRSIDERPDNESAGNYRRTCTEKQRSYSYDRDVKRQGKDVRSVVDFKRSVHRSVNSSSSSSDSSSGGGFSSSETESVHCISSRPKPIRTSTNNEYNTRAKQMNMYQFEDLQLKQKHEGKFVKTKSRAMKIYGDLKKVKQPISPGGRLATFLNSIFTTNNTKNNTKNMKLSSSTAGSYDDGKSISAGGSTCSSASSFSRSCLSKTPSSRGKLSNNTKRSVRFYPVSVIVGDDCQPCGHKSVHGDESNLHQHALKFVKKPNDGELRVYSNDKTRRIEEAARNLLRNYQKKVECEFNSSTNNLKVENEIDLNYDDDDDDEDDDVISNTSSDLFELENFSAIGMEDDELPVYETTNLDTNLAIGIGNSFRM